MERADEILRAVQQIYDSALSSEGWSGALDAVNTVAGGRHAAILLEDRPRQWAEMLTDTTWDPTQLDLVVTTAAAGVLPPWIPSLPQGVMMRTSAMQADSDFIRSVYYNEVIRPIGNFYGVLAVLERTPAQSGLIAIGRPHGGENFADDDVVALQMLLPHLARVLDLRRRAGQADLHAAAIETVLDRVDLGVILVDADGRPLYFNRPAEALLAGADGLSVGRAGIAAALAEDTRRLHRAIAAAAAAGRPGGTIDAAGRAAAAGAHIRVSRPSGRRPLLLTVIPVARARVHAGLAAQVAVFITDPDGAASPAPALLREMFGLTTAEAALAVEISRGQGLDAAADRLSIAKTTARTHLARIFDKTDTGRQAELVRLLLRCGVPLLPPD